MDQRCLRHQNVFLAVKNGIGSIVETKFLEDRN